MAVIDSDKTPKKVPGTEASPTADGGAADRILQRIQARAYELYEQRGRQHGHAEEDWIQAEQEVLSKTGRAAA
jgi:Protein of unknown function (DUF2934)